MADKITALTQADNGLVSAKIPQSFTAPEKLQARNNIDVYSKAEIGDTSTTTTNTWSSTKISTEITKAINNLINGADVSSDTLKELADKIAALTQADNGLVSAKISQSFTAPEKLQARNNIDVYSKAEIGDINTNFVATINTTFSS